MSKKAKDIVPQTNMSMPDGGKAPEVTKQRRGILSIVIALVLAVALCGAVIYAAFRVFNVTQEDLIRQTEDKITLVSENTASFLQKAKVLVATDAGSIEYIIENGGTNADILDYLIYQTDFRLADVDPNFTGVYGYYRGEYLDGNRWDPYADGGVYYPKERPWYTAAVAGKGEVSVATPYLDMDTGNIVLSITKLLDDGESVLGLDISLAYLSDYVNEYLAGNNFGYAYIIDKTGTIVASKDAKETGLNYFEGDAEKDELGVAEMFRKALATDEPFEFELSGHSHLVISKTIENDWQVIAVADASAVRAPLYTIAALCIVLIAAMIGVLLLFAIRSIIDNKKSREAEEKEQEYVEQLSGYKRAVLFDALISLEANLTKDELYYGMWKDDYGNTVPLDDIMLLSLPCSYDKYIRMWNERFVKNYEADAFSERTDRDALLEEFAAGRNEVTFDYEAETISGRSTWLRRSIIMTKNGQGDVIAYTSVKDISAHVQQTKKEESYIRALTLEYDSISVVHFEKDKAEDKVILHSRSTEDIVNLLGDDTVNETNFRKKLDKLMNFIHPDDVKAFKEATLRENILRSFLESRTHVVNFRIMSKDGDGYVYYQMRCIPLKDDDMTTGMIACLRNVDNEVRKELDVRKDLETAMIAAEDANQAKSTFLFNMSHDIRTPMNAIIGFTDIAEKHIDDKERVKDSLEKVKTSGEHLLSLINDVLDMSRIESDNVKIEEEPVKVDGIKENLFTILQGSAVAKSLTLTAEVLPSVKHHWIYADRLRMMRVLTNIVSNSVKYTNPGGRIDMTVEELPSAKEGSARLLYTVSDTGIGMTKEFLAHVFEPFSRAESATKSGVTGTGLGMSITKSLVELMGGTISIESEPGKGTTVKVDITHRISNPGSVEKFDGDNTDMTLEGRKILLVEDNDLNREIATEILEEEGIIVDTAEDGDIAVEKMKNAEKGQYDLILMDIQMPRMNGYDATRAIRKLPNRYAAKIPIIAMTANAFDEDKMNAIDAGMNGHIAKPIDVPKLIETIAALIKK